MTPENFQKLRKILALTLVGRTISLQDTSDHDGYEILGRIAEVTLEGNRLQFKTTETRRRWWGEEFKPCDQNEFSDSVEFIEKVKIEVDGIIIFIPWSDYDYVYIIPQP